MLDPSSVLHPGRSRAPRPFVITVTDCRARTSLGARSSIAEVIRAGARRRRHRLRPRRPPTARRRSSCTRAAERSAAVPIARDLVGGKWYLAWHNSWCLKDVCTKSCSRQPQRRRCRWCRPDFSRHSVLFARFLRTGQGRSAGSLRQLRDLAGEISRVIKPSCDAGLKAHRCTWSRPRGPTSTSIPRRSLATTGPSHAQVHPRPRRRGFESASVTGRSFMPIFTPPMTLPRSNGSRGLVSLDDDEQDLLPRS